MEEIRGGLRDKRAEASVSFTVKMEDIYIFWPKVEDDDEFRQEIRRLLAAIDSDKAAVLDAELKASTHWPKCAFAQGAGYGGA